MGNLVTISQGTCRGSLVDGVLSFKGIPYAQAPFGEFRMVPPVPHGGWEGERDCTAYGPTSPKGAYQPPLDVILPEVDIPGEESLNLNIWTPESGEGAFPVIVWIHGGAFVNGSGSVGVYDGSAFARDGVVCVTINYRLGADGFLFLDDGISNLGIQDQLAALRWVQSNISHFGGDPSKVTIAGESAGAFSVGTLLSLDEAKGLFRGAILQSGAGSHSLTPQTARKISSYLAEALGIGETRDAFRNAPIDELITAQINLGVEAQSVPDPERFGEVVTNLMIFEPVVDGEILKVAPIDGIRSGAGREVAVLIGTNAQEFNLFTVPAGLYPLINDEFLALEASGYGLPQEAVEVYRSTLPGEPDGEVFSKIGTDWFFRVPALRLAEVRSSYGSPTYVYEFRWGSPRFEGRLGACHALEIPFVFDTVRGAPMVDALVGEDPPWALANEMHGAWVSFVRDLTPGWPTYESATRQVRIFGGESKMETDPEGVTRALWEGIR